MAPTNRISNNKKRKAIALVKQATQALSIGRYDLCAPLCVQIEAIWPDNPDLANMRGVASTHSGDMDQAEAYFLQAIQAAPRRVEFCKNLATLYVRQNKPEAAAHWYQLALSLQPSSLAIILSLARLWIDLGRYEQARTVLEKARKHHRKSADIMMGLSAIHQRSRRYDQAMECIDSVLANTPDHQDALFEKAFLLRGKGQTDDAEQIVRQLLAINASHVRAGGMLSQLKRFKSDSDQDIALLNNIYDATQPDSSKRETICFALGKVMDDVQCYDRAFTFFEEGNAIRSQRSAYHANSELAHMQSIMQHYGPDMFQHQSNIDDATPIFIVGMPRCGSTLVEQILASHPDVSSRGEWHGFEDMLFAMHSEDQPLTLERITAFDSGQWQQIGRSFLHGLKEDAPEARRITDKTLINTRLIGAIHCALPQARIIHVRRNPLDTCLSIYQSNLISKQFDYAYKLGELGYYYRMYQRLMQHWRDILPEGVMYELDYEQLVSDQEGETRKLLDACDLPWHEQCLQFSKLDNVVLTRSMTQVRQSLYSDSINRWKHYEQHLQPLIKILG